MQATQTSTDYREALDCVIQSIVAPMAVEIDRSAAFPRAALDELARTGLLGLISATEVGGMGLGPRAAADVIERLAQHCASTAMVVCMHYAGTAVIEAHGRPEVAPRASLGEGKCGDRTTRSRGLAGLPRPMRFDHGRSRVVHAHDHGRGCAVLREALDDIRRRPWAEAHAADLGGADQSKQPPSRELVERRARKGRRAVYLNRHRRHD